MILIVLLDSVCILLNWILRFLLGLSLHQGLLNLLTHY